MTGASIGKRERRILLIAFIVQAVLVLLCIGATVTIFLEFRTKLSDQLALQKRLARELAEKQNELDQTTETLGVVYFNGGLDLIRVKQYEIAVRFFRDGVTAFPTDTYMSRGLVKALILNGNVSEALKFAATLSQNQPNAMNLLTLGIARCASHDVEGAADILKKAKPSFETDADVKQFCSPAILESVSGK